MVDRLNFFDSISGIQYPEMIVDFFDQFIALKQLVEDHGNIEVSESTEKSISFITHFNSSAHRDQAISMIQSGPIIIYGRPISIFIESISDVDIKFILQ